MEFCILGPLAVSGAPASPALRQGKPRAVLAKLLLHANQPVSAERLVEALWGEEAPAGAVRTVHVYISRLRKALGDADRIATMPAGYRLRVEPGELDVERFERTLAEGRRLLALGTPERASVLLADSLRLWRGPPLEEFAWAPFAAIERRRLGELHEAAIEWRLEADLAAGRHAELVPELQQLIGRHPWRERLHAQLLLALYRSGRQAEALEAYRRARELLVEELGIEPGAELQDLHQAILAHDAGLEPVTRRPHRRTGLPPPLNRTIGRTDQLRAVAERLRAEPVRLLTLTGPGGVGKTRLALEAARAVEADFADGACFVSLAALERSQDVAAAIVSALSIIPLAGESAEQAVERFLAAKHLLLVIDNCEHLPDAAPFLGGLPAAGPGVTVLATSRERLAVRAEQVYPVLPLPTGTSDGADAAALFRERAHAQDPAFELGADNADAVAEICRRVDGLPLGIELAAARCGLLSPRELAERLETALGALGPGARDAPGRQQTLRATIDWSHELLSDEERSAFARFAVFAGGATVSAAETVTGASIDTLDRLVAKSLLVRHRSASGSTRLRMLETVRAYAVERLAAVADREAVRERHFRYVLALAHRHGTDQALFGPERREHFARLDAEVDNLRAALEWASTRAAESLQLSTALLEYWHHGGRVADAVFWLEQALEHPSDASDPALRAHALCKLAWPLWPLGRGAEAPALLWQAEAIARTLDDPGILAEALTNRAAFLVCQEQVDAASPLAEEALSRASASRDPWAIAMAAWAWVLTAPNAESLRERTEHAAELLERAGNVWHLAATFEVAGRAALRRGSDAEAIAYLDRAAPLIRRLDEPIMWMLVRSEAGLAALFIGDIAAAQDAFRETLTICRDLVVRPVAARGLAGLAALAANHDDLDRAARLSGAAAAHHYAEPAGALDDRVQQCFLEPARERYGAGAWDAAAEEGAAMSFTEAIDYALAARPRPARGAVGT